MLSVYLHRNIRGLAIWRMDEGPKCFKRGVICYWDFMLLRVRVGYYQECTKCHHQTFSTCWLLSLDAGATFLCCCGYTGLLIPTEKIFWGLWFLCQDRRTWFSCTRTMSLKMHLISSSNLWPRFGPHCSSIEPQPLEKEHPTISMCQFSIS